MPKLRSGVRRGRAAVVREGLEPPTRRNAKKVCDTERAKAKNKKSEEEVVGVKNVMADGSGGLSANKGVASEDPSFPERVYHFLYMILYFTI